MKYILSLLGRNYFYWKRDRKIVTFYVLEKGITLMRKKMIMLSPLTRHEMLMYEGGLGLEMQNVKFGKIVGLPTCVTETIALMLSVKDIFIMDKQLI